MRQVRVQDLLAQSVVSILNLSARRIAKEDERDLEQARIGIDAVRGAGRRCSSPRPQREIRNALSELQMLYAQHAGERRRAPRPAEARDRRRPGARRSAPPPEPAGARLRPRLVDATRAGA